MAFLTSQGDADLMLRSPRRAWLLGLAAVGFIATAWLLSSLLGSEVGQSTRYPIGADFVNVWAGPRIAAHDLSALFDESRYMQAMAPLFDRPLSARSWSYPLYCLWFFAPFSALPYGWALALWSVLGLACYLLAARAVLPHARPALLWIAALSPFALINLLSGQNGFFTAALALAALATLGRRTILCGVLVGLLCIKPQLGLLWPFILLALRQWRSIAAAAATVMLLLGASLLLHGVEAWEQYRTITAPFQLALATDVAPLRLYHLMMASPLTALRLLAFPLSLAMALQLAIGIAVAMATLRQFPKLRTLAERAMWLGCGSLLITPYGFNYDAGVLTVAAVAGIMAGTTPWCMAVLYLVPILGMIAALFQLPITPWVLLMCFAALVFRYRRTA